MNDDKTTQNPDELRRQGKYTEAIPLYEEQVRQLPNSYNFRWLIHCHRKADNPKKALELCEYALRRFPDDQYLKSEMAWIVYDLEIKPAKEDEDFGTLLKAANKALGCDPENELLNKVVSLTVMRASKKANNTNWETIAEFAQKINPEMLSSTKRLSKDGRPYMSEKEEWYVSIVKAMLELNNFAMVLNLGHEGLKAFPKQIDLKRYIGQAQFRSGDTQTAENTYDALLTQPRVQWYIFAELAEIKAKLGKLDQATRLFSKAMLNGNEEQFMIGTMEQFASLLIDQKRFIEAQDHLALARQIRTEREWRIPGSLMELENRLQKQATSESVQLPEPLNSVGELKKICRQIWRKGENEGVTFVRGKIIDIDLTRTYVFIEPEDGGENIYARLKDIPKECHQWGAKVEFVTEKSFDAKKNKESLRATKIRKARTL